MDTFEELDDEAQQFEVTHRDATAIGLLLIACILLGWWGEWRERAVK